MTSKKSHLRVGFSLRKEIFFVAVGSIIGGLAMHLPRILFDITTGTQYLITLLVLARVVNSDSPEVGFALHIVAATIIGIITGVFLHKVIKLNISKIKNGLIYGVFAGVVVFVVFAIPVSQLILGPNMAKILTELDPSMTVIQASELVNQNFVPSLIDSFFMHLIWGLTLGTIASLLTRKIGANYRCHVCDVEFSKLSTYEKHEQIVHESPSQLMKKILILGGGYAGVGVLRQLQKHFENNVNINISLVSEDNFFLHTPMLPEMATGMIEPRHISTPIRSFCKRAKFFQAKVDSINIDYKKVTIKRTTDYSIKTLDYDYLVLALGGKTNFFGNKNIEKYSLTIKTLGDAIGIRNRVITMLEDADHEEDPQKLSKLLTFVVVGGGFSGVETVGEINDFVRESVERFYRNIDAEKIQVILITSGETILPEIGELGEHAKESLVKAGVKIISKTKLVDAEIDLATLSNGDQIPYGTLIWTGGNTVDPVVSELDTQHDKGGRIMVDKYLRLANHHDVYALGDCALIKDERGGTFYPPTAQHAIREAKTVSKNIMSALKGADSIQDSFIYDTKGSMAKIGKKDGVALLMGHKFKGFTAWFIWRQYYLFTLPTAEKRIRVGLDWFVDLFFPRDITRLTGFQRVLE